MDVAAIVSLQGARLLQQGQSEQAVVALERAVALHPDYAEAQFHLGSALHAHGRPDVAAAALRRALELDPGLVEAHYVLGIVQLELGQQQHAEAAFLRALELRPGYVSALNGLGNARQGMGRLPEAAEAYSAALEGDPKHLLAHSNLIFLITYHQSRSGQAIFDECERFYARHAKPLESLHRPFHRPRAERRRLRVGYLSPDFRSHVIASNFEPLLAAHDRQVVELFCYSAVQRPDDTTKRLRDLSEHWRDIATTPDEAVARQIREDRVDILVDLAWYTAGHRLLVFARRPAPVQATYLSFATTGFPVIDYLITDRWLHPPGQGGELHTERLYRLPRCFACYSAWPEAREVTPRPEQGPLTFGSFNTLWKLNPPVIALWARILRRVPGSRLLLKARQLADTARRDELTQAFADHGVEPARLLLRGDVTMAEHYAMYGEVDLALDPFPFGGGVTTFDALWMGVPVITLLGERFIGRMSGTMLEAIGRPRWIARNPDQYVELAVSLAGDRARLGKLRAGQRQRVQRSALCDGPGLARAMEQAYIEMWQRWCKDNPDPTG